MLKLFFLSTLLLQLSFSTHAFELYASGRRFFNPRKILKQLSVDRSGEMPNSNMTTKGIELMVNSDDAYQFHSGEGIKVIQHYNKKKLRHFKALNELPAGLAYKSFDAIWDKERGAKDNSNILGGNGRLIIQSKSSKLAIPVVKANEKFLRYYKAHLIKDGDIFKFETINGLPIFKMDIGENYADSYIMKAGGGFYLEYHNEPHYHEPLGEKSRGVYLLARDMGSAHNKGNKSIHRFHITAFKIPRGTAVYSEPGAIHDDAVTIGEWRVGYTNANKYSTVTVLNKKHQLVNFKLAPRR